MHHNNTIYFLTMNDATNTVTVTMNDNNKISKNWKKKIFFFLYVLLLFWRKYSKVRIFSRYRWRCYRIRCSHYFSVFFFSSPQQTIFPLLLNCSSLTFTSPHKEHNFIFSNFFFLFHFVCFFFLYFVLCLWISSDVARMRFFFSSYVVKSVNSRDIQSHGSVFICFSFFSLSFSCFFFFCFNSNP